MVKRIIDLRFLRRSTKIGISLMGLLLLFAACVSKQQEEKVVSVTIEPQRYFAERIAGDRFTIHCVVPEGQSPETYDPTPRQMVRIGQGQAYLRIGTIGFELAWMDNIQANNPEMRVFDLSEGIQPLKSPEEGGAHALHTHSHGEMDPHIWNSIAGARLIAKNTRDAFMALDPEGEDFYQANYEELMEEIRETEAAISSLLRPLRHKAFIIYHPALTYFAAEYGLTQLCIEIDGKEPSPAQLEELVRTARAHDAKVVFIQQEFDQKNAELIAEETGCRLVRINPLDYHWNAEMIHIAKALADGEVD